MNKVMLFGRLGRDPEVRSTAEDIKVCHFPLATHERYRDKAGEWKEATEWHRVVVFGRTAETCESYLTKGREVLVEGRLRTREWEGQDGGKRYTTEVVASNVTFAGGRGGEEPDHGGRARAEADDEIPF